MLKVWIDGACAPVNPGGTASYGLIVLREIYEGYGSDPAGWEISEEQLLQESKVIGTGKGMSNNVAEYSALIAFLKWYQLMLTDETVIIHSDSQLLVNQMQGKWKVNQPNLYAPYCFTAKAIIRDNQLMKNISFKWIPREENLEADRLSKEAIPNDR